MLTAFGRAKNRAVALKAGFQTHMKKPAEPAELVVVVESLIENGAQSNKNKNSEMKGDRPGSHDAPGRRRKS
jgi:DNA-binding response OmpR family regulator